ncbi:hypothetical protein NPIL_109861, partial [Nephila pilipes]
SCNKHVEDFHQPEHILSSTPPISDPIPPAIIRKIVKIQAPPKKPTQPAIPRKIVKIQNPPKKPIPPATSRKIVKIQDPPKKIIQPAFLPLLPDYKFFCRHCHDYYPSNSSLTEHLKNSHNITVKTFRNSFQSKTIQLSPNSPPAPSKVDTQIEKNDVMVSHIEDHQDLLPPLTAALKNFYIPDPSNISSKIPPSQVIRPNISRIITSNSITDSPADSDDNVVVTTHAEIHHSSIPSSPSSDSPPRKCNLCSFVAKNRKGLKLNFFRKHKFQVIPVAKNSADDFDQITLLPSSLPPTNVRTGANSDSVKIDVGTSRLEPTKKKVSFQLSNLPDDSQDFTEKVNLLPPIKNKVPAANKALSLPVEIPFVSFKDNVLKYSFPLPTRLCCTIDGCSAAFGTRYWFRTIRRSRRT